MAIIEILIFLGTISLPVIFAFLGQANLTSNILTSIVINKVHLFNSDGIAKFKDYCILASIILTFLPLGLLSIRNKLQNERLNKQQSFLVHQIKVLLMQSFENLVEQQNIRLKLRIFIKKNSFIKRNIKILGVENKIVYRMKNIEGFTDNNIKDGLSFEVFPKVQGLIGDCYIQRKIVYDENLKASTKDYHLSDFQKEQTHNTVFCLCIPLINTKEEIYAIITLDSDVSITIHDENKYTLFSLLKTFGTRFGEEMANFFK